MISRKTFAVTGAALLAVVAVKFAPLDGIVSRSEAAQLRPTAESVIDVDLARPIADGLKLVVASSGNEVRYRIREQLVRLPMPNDAIGKTGSISGGISLDKNGKIVPAESKFIIDASTLSSDREMRDNYVRRRILETERYPTVEFTPTAITGLNKIPASGTHTFNVTGNLTVRGVTKPTTWRVTATAGGASVTGTAATRFNFADFNLAQPRVPVLISVQDTIKLEYDFSLVPKS